MSKTLPLRPHLDWYRKSAKKRLIELRQVRPAAKLSDAQLAVARQHGFASWGKFTNHIQRLGEVKDKAPLDPGIINNFFDAIGRGDLPAVDALLQAHPDLTGAQDADGQFPLHAAASGDRAEIVKLLVDRGADRNAKLSRSAHTALSWALTVNAAGSARVLVENGATPDLFCAAGLGDVNLIAAFFDGRGKLKPDTSRTGSSRYGADGAILPCPPETAREVISDALYLACRNAREQAVAELLRHDPDLSFRAFIGGTALHWAYFGGSPEIVGMLLAAGANPRLRDNVLGCTPRAFGICVPANWGMAGRVRQRLEQNPSLVNIMGGRGTPLHEAARGGHAGIAQMLLESGADSTLRDREGNTPSQVAREAGHLELSAMLESVESPSIPQTISGASISEADHFLDLAVTKPDQDHRGGRLEPAEELLAANPSLGKANIYTAAVVGNHSHIAEILRENPELANAPGGIRNWPPLCYLTFSKFLRIQKKQRSVDFARAAKALLDAGADANGFFEQLYNGKTWREAALYGACGVANDARLTRLLLERGAAVANPPDEESLYHVTEFPDHACLKLLLEHKPSQPWLNYCMAHMLDREDPAGLKLFLDHGGDPNFLIDRGQMQGSRILHFAIDRGRSAKIIRMLLKAGADPNLPDSTGVTPYALARRLGQTDVAEVLLKHGAEDDLSERARCIAAIMAGDMKAARKMLENQPAVLTSIAREDRQLLPYAAGAGKLAAVKFMLNLGFDVNAKYRWGTAIHHAAWSGHADIVKLLIAHGADLTQNNDFGGNLLGTAIHGASHGGHRNGAKVVAVLLKALPDADLSEALAVAKTGSDPGVIGLLERVSGSSHRV